MTVSLDEELVSTPDSPALARRLLGRYLRDIGWSAQQHEDDLILAVSEAITNAAEHAYPAHAPGPVLLNAHVMAGPNGTRRVRVSVTDQGRWHDPSIGRTGGGLRIMRAACSHVGVRGDATGTRLTLISRLDTGRRGDAAVGRRG